MSGSSKKLRSVKPEFFDLYGIEEINGHGVCVVCHAKIPNESLKPNKLDRHLKTHDRIAVLPADARKRAFKRYAEQNEKSRKTVRVALNQTDRIAVFNLQTAFLIAQNKRPYVEGEAIVKPTLLNFVKIFENDACGSRLKQVAQSVRLSNDTIERRIGECARDISDQVIQDLRQSPWISIAIDESTDNTSQPQLALYGRYIRDQEISEELLAILTLETTTRGTDIYAKVCQFFDDNDIDWAKVSECNMDGAPAMMGHLTGFRGLLLTDHPHVRVNHCLIHRQALASKELSAEFADVMNVVVTTINFIKARDLNARLFIQLCVENNAQYDRLLYHNAVRWLSRGKALKRVFLLRNEVEKFLSDATHKHADQFKNPYFVAKLALLTDIFVHMNCLNTEMQGNKRYVFDLQSSIKGFLGKLDVLAAQIAHGDFTNLPCFVEFLATVDIDFADAGIDFSRELDACIAYLAKLKQNFRERFPELETESFDMVQNPFTCDAMQFPESAMLLVELKADNAARLNYKATELTKFWCGLSEKYSELMTMALKTLVRLGTTYVCEAGFSTMTFIKNKYRSRLTNEHLNDTMICATTGYSPRYEKMVK